MSPGADSGLLPIGQPASRASASRMLSVMRRGVVAFIAKPGRLAELGRYTAVSATALVLDLVVFVALMKSGAFSPAIAGALGVLSGLAVHFLLSLAFVFDAAQTGKSMRRLAGEYAVTGVLGFAVTWTVVEVSVGLLGFSAGLGKLLAVGATFVSVYLVRAGLVFCPRAQTDTDSAFARPTQVDTRTP